MHGKADIVVRRIEGKQRVDYFHQSPMRIFLPKTYSDEAEAEIILANTSGGLVGGDELQVNVVTEEKATAVITSQAAEKAYRSDGRDATIRTNLTLRPWSRLRWIPQETILFDGVRLRRRTVVDVDGDASALAGEMLVFGRSASGEHFTHGLVHDEWRVKFQGKLVWADSLHLSGDVARQMESSVGFGKSNAHATLLYVSSDAPDQIDGIKSLIKTNGCKTGATLIGHVVIIRWLGSDATLVRQAYTNFLEAFVSMLDWADKSVPIIWSV